MINVRNGNVVNHDIHGELKVSASISEPVDINIFLQTPSQLGEYSAHDCLYKT